MYPIIAIAVGYDKVGEWWKTLKENIEENIKLAKFFNSELLGTNSYRRKNLIMNNIMV